MSLTKATSSMISGAPINVLDYIPFALHADIQAKTSTTDVSTYIQTALDIAVTTGGTVNIPYGRYWLASSLIINKGVDTALGNRWLTIKSDGGILYTESAITMLDSTLPYYTGGGVGPASAQIIFDGLIFETSTSAVVAYAFSDNFLRCLFENCTFYKIKMRKETGAQYSQSLYFNGCVARAWAGILFDSPTITYDLKVNLSMAEAPVATGGSAFNLGSVRGCSITNNVIEGLYGYAIQYSYARGFQISGNYFEANTTANDIIGTDGATSTSGVAITGNHFQQDPAKVQAQIKWSGATQACFAAGNVLNSNGTLHDIAATDQVNIIDSTAGGDIATQNRKQWFIDKVYRNKGGYIYGNSTDGNNAYLTMGVRYDDSTDYDLIQLLWTQKVMFCGASYTLGLLNHEFDGSTEYGFVTKNTDAAYGGQFATFVNNANTIAGGISHTGASSVNYGTTSDYRLKEDPQPITNATLRLKQLNPINFAWKSDGTRVDGFFAHEAQAVVPNSVVGDKDAMRGHEGIAVPKHQDMDNAKLIPLMVATIQELEARISALES